MQCKEGRQNHKLAGLGFCTIQDATHKLNRDGIKSNPRLFFASGMQAVRMCWWQFLRITSPIRYPLGLRQEKIVNMLGKIRLPSSR